MPMVTSNDQEIGKPKPPITGDSDIRSQALDELIVEMANREVPRQPAARQSTPTPPPIQARPRREAPVAYQPAPRRRLAAVREAEPDWTSRILLALCIGCLLLGAVLFYRGPMTARSSSAAVRARETGKIEDARLGERILGRNPIRSQAELVEPDPATWRHVSLRMKKRSGLNLWIELLRPLTWIEEHNARPGSTIFLDLHEMGAVGDAEVTYLGPCPEIQPGTGRGTVITGTFKHEADENTKVVRLRLQDQPEPTGVTDNHLYWSADRQDFVEVGQLRIGELVDTEYGLKRVVSITPIEHTGFLYNLETTEHVFRVGSLGALVHNSCADEFGRGMHITNKVGAGAARPPRHHIFPQEHRQWFADRGFNIDRVTVQLDQGTHSALHTMKWNQQIMGNLTRQEALLGRQLTPKEIWRIGYRQMRIAEIDNLLILPYID